MKFISSLYTRYEVVADEWSDDLAKALEAWQDANDIEGKKLYKVLSSDRDRAKALDKGMEYDFLYRAIGLSPKRMKSLLAGSLKKPEGQYYESWTASLDIARYWRTYHNVVGSFTVLLGRYVPEKERVVCLPCGDFKNVHNREKEVICVARTHSPSDIYEIYITNNEKEIGEHKEEDFQEVEIEDVKNILKGNA